MKIFTHLPIRTKLTLVMTLLLAVLSVGVFLYFPATLERRSVEALLTNAAAVTQMGAAALGKGVAAADAPAVAEALSGMRRQTDLVYVVVTDKSGAEFTSFNDLVAAQMGYATIPMTPLRGPFAAPAPGAPSGAGAHDIRGGFSADRSVYQTAAPIRYSGRTVGTLYLGMSLDGVRKAASRSRAAIALVTLIALLVGIIAVYAISIVITGPLERIVDTAEQIAGGDLSRRADVHAGDEVGQLATAFNSMVDRLHAAWKELEQWGHTLERRVEERTHELQNEVDERTRAEKALRNSEEKYRLLFERNLAGVYVASEDGRILTCNDACARIFGYPSREEFLAAEAVVPYMNPRDHDTTMRRLREEGAVANQEVELRSHEGATVWVLQNVRRVVDDTSSDITLEGIVLDISDRKHTEEEIAFRAYHDALTGLPNRSLFLDRLTVALAHAQRSSTRLAVMFLDLDEMKAINDTLGHSVGDELLKLVSSCLVDTLRPDDTVARVGGDEFLILLAEVADERDAERAAERVLACLRQPFVVENEELYVTTSIGVAVFPGDGETTEELIRSADGAMYQVKQRGGDAFRFRGGAQRPGPGRLSLEQQLRAAIDRDEFVVHYQPQVSITAKVLTGAEALVRWNHPGRDLIVPAAFIPAAEHSGLIAPIGELVLRKACEQMVVWRAAGAAPPRVSVNVSARQFHQRDFIGVIDRVIAASGLDPRFLELEITETVAMQKTDRSLHMLHALRERGIAIAIDDFGTGQSSLTYLKRFPLDAVKIDKSFVSDLDKSGSDEWIVTAVLMLATQLGLRTVAEGVETVEQCDFLHRHGCSDIQGYLISRPVAPDVFAEKFLTAAGAAAIAAAQL